MTIRGGRYADGTYIEAGLAIEHGNWLVLLTWKAGQFKPMTKVMHGLLAMNLGRLRGGLTASAQVTALMQRPGYCPVRWTRLWMTFNGEVTQR
ncbi:hypothetical protein OK016_05280 [Vibrio chagasii]|nr:hypothetical protein [Vibrio chagasii]